MFWTCAACAGHLTHPSVFLEFKQKFANLYHIPSLLLQVEPGRTPRFSSSHPCHAGRHPDQLRTDQDLAGACYHKHWTSSSGTHNQQGVRDWTQGGR